MNRKFIVFTFLWLAVLSACTSPLTHQEVQKAEMAAVDFFRALSQSDYHQAVDLYGGDYSQLQYLNPSISPDDHAALWKSACEINGYQCLQIRQVLETDKFSLNEYSLLVEFELPDGSLFVLGPCCGADEADMPPVSQFEIFVVEREGQFLLYSLPVLVP